MSLSATSMRLLNTSWDWDSSSSLGSPYLHVEILPNVQSKLSLLQLEIIFPCPIMCYQRKETGTVTATSFDVAVEGNDMQCHSGYETSNYKYNFLIFSFFGISSYSKIQLKMPAKNYRLCSNVLALIDVSVSFNYILLL